VAAISAGSRIVPRLIDALEADRQDLLPAPVYVRGFIRAYCNQVGADAVQALRIYDAQTAPAPPATVRATSPPALTSPTGRRWRRIAAGSLLVTALGVATVLLLGRRQPDAVAGRGGSATMIASRSAAPVVPAPPATSAGPPSPVPSAGRRVPASAAPAPVERVLLMRATDTTWVRVQPDGAQPTEETLAPGTVREWRSAGRFHITVGNAGGVELALDGHALPALGAPGQVVRDATVPGEAQP
jgi:cytoskeleton protein RodZ